MYDDIVERLQRIRTKGFAPDQLIKELLYHLAREQREGILEHAWYNAAQVFHDRRIVVLRRIISGCSLYNVLETHAKECYLVYGQVYANSAVFVHPPGQWL